MAMFDIAKIDEFLRRCDSSTTDEELRSAFAGYSAAFDLNVAVDPFSETYRQRQMELYRQLAGRPYSIANEVTSFDAGKAAVAPFPYSHGSSDLVGNQLMAIGYVIRAMALPKHARVLEFGPGWGNTTLALAKMGFDVTGVDIEKNFCDLIAARAELERLKIDIVHSDFSYIDAVEGKFDAVLFFECFHHASDHLALMSAFDRVLKPGGIVCFGAEPITPDFPIPWGLRMDGESVWAIRRNGWLELGFNERYFEEAMSRNGWILTTHRSADCPWISAIVATRKSETGGIFRLSKRGIQTQIGTVSVSGTLVGDGQSGYLAYGPYISLPKGNYRARFVLDASVRKSGVVVFDVAFDGGRKVAAKLVVDMSQLAADDMAIDFTLDGGARELEVRLFCEQGATVAIAYLDIKPT
jgi:2-polyprenyl-3-methyl-5-hydroxy-6-metoxy-1,4-benzoquinol methylase